MKSQEMIIWESKPTFEYVEDSLGHCSLIINRKSNIPIQCYLHKPTQMEAEDKAWKFVLEKRLEYEKAIHDFEEFKHKMRKL